MQNFVSEDFQLHIYYIDILKRNSKQQLFYHYYKGRKVLEMQANNPAGNSKREKLYFTTSSFALKWKREETSFSFKTLG